jgi:hypothetical protein
VAGAQPGLRDAVEQEVDRGLSLELERLGHRGQRDPAQTGDRDVVEADNRQLTRDAHAGRLARLHHRDGPDVVGDEQGGGGGLVAIRAQQVRQRHRAPPEAHVRRARLPLDRGDRRLARLAHGRTVSGISRAVAAALDQRSAHVPDAAMAEFEQMLHGQLDAFSILWSDRVAPVLAQAQEDDRNIRPAQRRLELRGASDEGEEHDAGDAVLEQRLHAGHGDVLVALDVAEHCRVAATEGLPFDDPRHLRVVRVVEVAHQHAEHGGALLSELPGDRVRLVIEPSHHLQHPLAGGVGHVIHASHHVRHRRLGDPGRRRHVDDRGVLGRPARTARRFACVASPHRRHANRPCAARLGSDARHGRTPDRP